MTHDWRQIWGARSRQANLPVLEQLLRLDGFDNPGTEISEAAWRTYVRSIAQHLRVEPTHSVFEVGCGAGAFLYPLDEMGCDVGGIDYSEALIESGRFLLPAAGLAVREAADLPVEPGFDFVVAHSVFHYFPDRAYAESVLSLMIEKARLAAAVFDLIDAASVDASLAARRDVKGADDYDAAYNGLDHLAFDKSWVSAVGGRLGCEVEFFKPDLEEYLNSRFRFSAIFWKGGR